MTEIRDDLRAVMKRARTNPVRWGRPQGLRQEDLAGMTNVSTVWIRQIESGYKQRARAATIGSICYALGIDAEYLRNLGYPDVADVVADCVDAAILLGEKTTVGGIEPPFTLVRPVEQPLGTEDYIRDAPGLTETEKEQLVEALRGIRRAEPLGKDLWRRRRKT